MVKKIKALARHVPTLYPYAIRAPRGTLPEAIAVSEMGLKLSVEEFMVVRTAMAIHAASRQPKLTWRGWRHIAVACAIGAEHARKAAGGGIDINYRRTMGQFLKASGFVWLNKQDRALAVKMLPHWDEIDAWRASLSSQRQAHLNNPREVWDAYQEHRKALGDPDTKPRPPGRKRRQFPTMLDQLEALAEQVEMLQERVERTEHQRDFFVEMLYAAADKTKMSEDDMADLRAKARAKLDAEREAERDELRGAGKPPPPADDDRDDV